MRRLLSRRDWNLHLGQHKRALSRKVMRKETTRSCGRDQLDGRSADARWAPGNPSKLDGHPSTQKGRCLALRWAEPTEDGG